MSESGPSTGYPPTHPIPGIDYPDPYERAALSVWASGAIWIMLAGCCSAGMVAATLLPIDQLRAQDAAGEIPDETWEQFAQFQSQPGIPAFLAVLVTLCLLPGLALLVLGFFVKKRHQGSALAALIVTYGMAGIVGLMTLSGLVSVLSGQVTALITLVPVMAALALMIWSIGTLRKARAAPTTPLYDTPPGHDPWEHML